MKTSLLLLAFLLQFLFLAGQNTNPNYDPELYNWYGSAALPEYLEASDRIWKINP